MLYFLQVLFLDIYFINWKNQLFDVDLSICKQVYLDLYVVGVCILVH